MLYQGWTELRHAATPGHNIDPSKAPRLNGLLTVGGASKRTSKHMNSPSNIVVTVLVSSTVFGMYHFGLLFGCPYGDFEEF